MTTVCSSVSAACEGSNITVSITPPGPQGPAGPTGETGPMGPAGPPGPARASVKMSAACTAIHNLNPVNWGSVDSASGTGVIADGNTGFIIQEEGVFLVDFSLRAFRTAQPGNPLDPPTMFVKWNDRNLDTVPVTQSSVAMERINAVRTLLTAGPGDTVQLIFNAEPLFYQPEGGWFRVTKLTP